jgi:hypothetical protein
VNHAHVVTSEPKHAARAAVERIEKMLAQQAAREERSVSDTGSYRVIDLADEALEERD